MKTLKKLFFGELLLAMIAVGFTFGMETFAMEALDDSLPKGWGRSGNKSKEYQMVLDKQTTHSGKSSAMVKFTGTDASGFGTLAQGISPDNYFGKRIRLSGFVKTVDAEQASFWLRVDGKDQRASLAFDNMNGREVKGTQDWKKYEIVLDVSPEAVGIYFGMMLVGKGQMWADDMQIEVVGKDIPVTDLIQKKAPKEPQNLGFED